MKEFIQNHKKDLIWTVLFLQFIVVVSGYKNYKEYLWY